MAIVTRTNGDAFGVNNVGSGRTTANASIINTGIASPITAYKITTKTGDLKIEGNVGGAIETILRTISGNATVIAYQVDDNNQLSVITERSGWASDAALKTAISGNVGGYGNVWIGGTETVSSSGGIKLA